MGTQEVENCGAGRMEGRWRLGQSGRAGVVVGVCEDTFFCCPGFFLREPEMDLR